MSSKGKLCVKCEENQLLEPHPHCAHGPTLLFYHENETPEKGFYGCAAYRDKKMCSFHLPADAFTEKYLKQNCETSTQIYKKLRYDPHAPLEYFYCVNCDAPVGRDHLKDCADHNIIAGDLLKDPTQFLRPLDNDKGQAQYFFDERALSLFVKCFRDMGINKVVCIGAPRLHTFLKLQCEDINSFLLDFDKRFLYFFDDWEYAWYNMCNNYFFDSKQKIMFHNFLNKQKNEHLLIFTDPPYGCRTEVIANTLHQLVQLYHSINKSQHFPLPLFWIYPYFSEHYIQEVMPEMQMSDYKVNYTNHCTYTDGLNKTRTQGSPARIFTNVPLESLMLPVEEEYKYCACCKRYTALENRHCKQCGVCPSKNGSTYKHCRLCSLCVKPSYVHCRNCRRCTQVEGHNCTEYQTKQRCWICRQLGHIEKNCTTWQNICNKMILLNRNSAETEVVVCFICGQKGHNELKCKERLKYFEETAFCGEVQVKLKL